MARLAALLIVLSLTGPSLAAVACDWVCVSQHAAAVPSAATGCHEHAAADGPAFVPGQACHDLAGQPLLVNPTAPQGALTPAVIHAVHTVANDAGRRPHAAARGRSTAPPGPPLLEIPLRI